MNTLKFAKKLAIPLFVALAYVPSQGFAQSILGTQLASFAVLGSSTVTNTGATTIWGYLGDSPGGAPTGLNTITINGINGALPNPYVHFPTGLAATAQTQLDSAQTSLNNLAVLPGTINLTGQDLGGLTLAPGVYSYSSSAQLTGTLKLDGGGNANAAWVFQIGSTLTTASGSKVDVINTGPGAGVFWNVGSSATLGTTTSFQGNILANQSITMNTGATIGCGRALADNAAVTMDTNTVSIGCLGTGEEGSYGLSGGLTVVALGDTPTFLPVVAAIPEPETYAMLLSGLGLMGFVARRRQRNLAAAA